MGEYIAALDVGTTTIKCQILNSKAQVTSSAVVEGKLVYPQPGYVEINPDQLWESIVLVIKQAITNANLTPSEISCLGISTLRSTFITWKKDTGVPFHNFITWKDLRADHLVRQWNRSLIMKGFRCGCYFLHKLTRDKRYLAGSGLNFTNNHATIRLAWAVHNIPELKIAIQNKEAMYGTVDTWLLYKLTGGRTFVTDISNACGSGFYDPFKTEWGIWTTFLNIPQDILPKVVNDDYNFGCTDESIFGVPIPIKSVVGDQSASTFGSCCFNINDIKVTLGTGSFINVNTGQNIHTGLNGLYPLIGWKINNEPTHVIEASCNDTGSLIQWALTSGLAKDAAETSTLASELKDNDGVYFIPAFSGLGPPIQNDTAASGFIGLQPTSTRSHMIRAILESIVYRITLTYNVLKNDTHQDYKKISVDGGVSQNDFVCQLLADVTGLEVERPTNHEMSLLGAACLAGLNAGIWKDIKEIKSLRIINRVFQPTKDVNLQKKYSKELNEWLKAAERFKSWYKK